MEPKGLMKPTWVDGVIQNAVDTGDAKAIASALANSPQILNAINSALEQSKDIPHNVVGPNRAQRVRQAIIAAITADA